MKTLNQKELIHVNSGCIFSVSNITICNRYIHYILAKKPQTYLS